MTKTYRSLKLSDRKVRLLSPRVLLVVERGVSIRRLTFVGQSTFDKRTASERISKQNQVMTFPGEIYMGRVRVARLD